MTDLIVQLIITYSLNFGIDPSISLAIAKTESNMNPNAIGSLGEVGLFQVRPEFSKYTEKQLTNPATNIKEGLRILKNAQHGCNHQKDNTWVVCFNTGIHYAKRIKHPTLFPYYKKVMYAKKQINKELKNLLIKKVKRTDICEI